MAQQPAPQEPPQPAPAAPPALEPENPMADLPDIGVNWPDMAAPATLETPEAVATDDATDSGERKYSFTIEGADKLSAVPLKERFNVLSALKAGQKDRANTAQIDRRVREDRDLLEQILKTSGYYDPDVESIVESSGTGDILVRFIVNAGPLYRFDSVRVDGLEGTGVKAPELEATFGVAAEDAVDADDVVAGRDALEKTLKDGGYPFAKVSEPEVVVDHDARSGVLAMNVETGGLRNFGAINITSANPPFDAKHVGVIARFKAGQPYDQTKIEDLRRALVATGIVGSVAITPVPAADVTAADIQVALEKAPLRTIAGEIGYDTGEGIRAEVNWTHRNFIKPEGALTLRGVAGTQEQLAGIILRQSNFRKRDHVLNAALLVSNLNRNAFDARTVELSASLGRQSNIIWQKRWTWSGGIELLATDERDMTRGLLAGRTTFLIAAMPLSIGYDRSNDLLNPTKGFRLSARISPEISLRNGTNSYLRTQIDGSAYLPFGDRLVIAARARMGSIFGADTFSLAPSRRFYSGGGGSVRGYGYQSIGPRDAFNDPVGGRSLAEFGLEARIRFGDFGVVPFIDGGSIYDTRIPKFSDFRFGAGIGGRYYSSFGPIRIDVGTPINPRKGDSKVTVFVSLGQAF
jgi:translocation and assembly module TamA